MIYALIRKEQAILVVGAASSRDHLISRLACDELSRVEAAPTGFFYAYLDFPDKRHDLFSRNI
jgi:hypothetical protein